MSNGPISAVELELRRLATVASLSKDLEAITAWGCKNMVEFNASKTQYYTLSNKRCPSEHSSQEVLRTIQPSHAQIRASLEYCSHIWKAAAPTTLSILDAVQRRAIRLIGDPALTCHLQPLSYRRGVLLVNSQTSTDYAVSLLVMVIGSLGGMRNTLLSALRAMPVCRAAAHILAATMQRAIILGSLRLLRAHDTR
nr:unnamed protein product [Callosobruchus chinensis]